MFNSTIPRSLKVAVAAGFISALAFSPLALAAEQGKENLDASASKEITGEVVDMMCYVDHNAMGDKHAGCAAKCIKGGGPVGIVSDGKAYLLVGDHKPMNDQLAEYAAKQLRSKAKWLSAVASPCWRTRRSSRNSWGFEIHSARI